MKAEQEREHLPAAAELSCSWCDELVPVPAGDYSGVCIRCGTVMFRDARGPLANLAEAAAPAEALRRVAVPAGRA